MDKLLEMKEDVSKINKHYIETSTRSLDLERFNENYLRLHIEKIEFSKPETIIKICSTFDNQKDQHSYIEALLSKMRENKLDIRKFKFS
jgi:hypothetical protein